METVKKNTVVAAVYFKKLLTSAIEELKKPEHRNIEKKIALSVLIIAFAVVGIYSSIGMMVVGLKVLEESGVSKVLLQRIIGSAICIAGVLVFRAFIVESRDILLDLIWNKKPEEVE